MKIAVQKWRAELGAKLHCFCMVVLAEIATLATPNYLRHTLVHGEEEPVHTQTRTHARTHTQTQTDVPSEREPCPCCCRGGRHQYQRRFRFLLLCSGSSRDQLTFSDSFEGVLLGSRPFFRGHRTIHRTENGPFRDGTRLRKLRFRDQRHATERKEKNVTTRRERRR